jgi:hypothetical protein
LYVTVTRRHQAISYQVAIYRREESGAEVSNKMLLYKEYGAFDWKLLELTTAQFR